jgi:agmatine/peptidylarginine deiminase
MYCISMQETKKSNNMEGSNRTERGAWIAINKRIVKVKGQDVWIVPSSKPGGFYKVTEDGVCECEDFKFNGVGCKHFVALMGYDAVPRLRLERVEKKSHLYYQEVKA